jgi:hypothetical protein
VEAVPLLWPSEVKETSELPAAEWEYHMQLTLHPPQFHHCLGLKAKGGRAGLVSEIRVGRTQEV